jgi:hypothetical protein
MKQNRKQPRQSADLSEALSQRLNTYALAAGAAGVSLLALAQPAEAQVQFTTENIVMKRQSSILVDFDVVPEFIFYNNARPAALYSHLDVFPNGTAAVVVSATYLHSVLALTKGSKIGSSKNFGSYVVSSLGPNMVFSGLGNWVNVKDRYVGLRFQLSDGTHYGWARFSVQVTGKKIIATFTGYAYEETANTPIIAGDTGISSAKTSAHPQALLDAPLSLAPASQQPASLGMLALGAQGIPFWRKEQAAAAK